MTSPRLDGLDGRRLAVAAELASGAWPAACDRDGCEALLKRLCDLVGAHRGVVQVAHGGPDDLHTTYGAAPAPGGAETVVEVALRSGERTVGTIQVARPGTAPFGEMERLLVELVSPRFALAIERQRLSEAESTARAAAGEAIALLREKEARFEAMVESVFDLIGLASPDGYLLEVNRAALAIVGLTRADVLGRPFWETPWWTHDPGQARRVQEVMAAAATGTAGGFEATHLTTGGEVVVVDFMVRPVMGEGGAVSYLVLEGRDVTTRSREHQHLARTHDELAAQADVQAGRLARAEGALEATQAMHRAVVETIVDGIVVIDATGTIHWTNPAAVKMFGYEAGDLDGVNVSALMPGPASSAHGRYLHRYVATGERRIIGIGREVVGRRKDGTEFPMYLAVGETTVDGASRFIGIVRDLSQTRQLERLLQERQTLARIGELAAVVAHEVRNPLAAIRGVVEVIQTRFPPDSSDRKVLGDLLSRVDSLDQLVGDLLVYARPAPPVFRRTRVLSLVKETAALVGNDPAASELTFEVTGEDDELWLDPAHMGRAVLNLLTNAAHAIRRQGVVRVMGGRDGARYRLAFVDEGPGMPEDVRARCLEPFFTTKTRGTGLGLPIARRVVEEHGGALSVDSGPGAGTRVTIELPTMAAASAS
ncbi:MAG: PAS domain S-box protein [Vicinamibacterales bacterium]